MLERAILTAQQCGQLLAAGHEYNVIKRVEPGYWLVDTTREATRDLETASRVGAGLHYGADGNLIPEPKDKSEPPAPGG